MAQVGRISGPLLKSNLERNGIDLAFKDVSSSTPTLFLDVNNNRIGVVKNSPIAELDLGTIGVSEYQQQGKFTDRYSFYGDTVDISGDYAVSGNRYFDVGAVNNQGIAYVYKKSGNTWTEIQQLTASDGIANDGFGYSVAIDGDTIVVTARGVDVGAQSNAGAVYVFTRNGDTWTQQGSRFTTDTPIGGRNFGISCDISGDTIVVGADGISSGLATNIGKEGAAYVFTRTGDTWTQQQKLESPTPSNKEYFGQQVAISGDTIIAGAYLRDVGTKTGAGAAFVFTRSSGTWSQQQELTASDADFNDRFAESVDIDGDYIVCGAQNANPPSPGSIGAIYIFYRSGNTWTQQQRISAFDATGTHIGERVGIAGNTIVVGARPNNLGGGIYSGTAYVFTRSGTTWTLKSKHAPAVSAPFDDFGAAIATDGDSFIVSSVGYPAGSFAGAIFIFSEIYPGPVLNTTQAIISNTAQFQNWTISPNGISISAGDINLITDNTVPSGSPMPPVRLTGFGTGTTSEQFLAMRDNNIGSVNNSDIVLDPAGTGTVEFPASLSVDGNMFATGNIRADGNLTLGSGDEDDIVIGAELVVDLVPDSANTYKIGEPGKQFDEFYGNEITMSFLNGVAIKASGSPTPQPGSSTVQNLGLDIGNTFFVSQNGNDSDAGFHPAGPFRTLKRALDAADASTSGPVTIRVSPGSFEEITPLVVPANVTIIGEDMRNTIIRPESAYQSNDIFLLEDNTTIMNLTIQDFYYDSGNDTGYAFRFNSQARIATRSPYIQNVTVITKGTTTSASDPRGFASGDAGKGAIVDGAVLDVETDANQASMLFHSATFITPGVDALTCKNGVRVEWLNCFTYFANIGINCQNGTGRTTPDSATKTGVELRSIASACVYGNTGIQGDGNNVLIYAINHNLAYIGTGKFVDNDPSRADQTQEVVKLNSAKVYFTSQDHTGDFRVGDQFFIDLENGTTSLDITQAQFDNLNSLQITTGGSTTEITPTSINVGDFLLSGNTIQTLSNNFLLNSHSTNNQINFLGNVTMPSLDLDGQLTINGNLYYEYGLIPNSTTLDDDAKNIIPYPTNTYNIGASFSNYTNLHVSEVNSGNIRFIDNKITNYATDENLNFGANGTGKVSIKDSDFELTTGNFIGNGTSTFDGLQVNGNFVAAGGSTLNFLSGYSATNFVTEDINVSNETQLEDIKFDGTTITTTASNSNLDLNASGTGNIEFYNLTTQTNLNINKTLTFSDNNFTRITAKFDSGNIKIYDNVIETTESNSDLELRSYTGKVKAEDVNFQTSNTIGSDSTDVEINANLVNITGSNKGLKLGKGTTAQQDNILGGLRFNTDENIFEGYVTGWLGFNGLYSDDKQTRVIAHPTDNTLLFKAGGVNQGTIDSTKLTINGLQADEVLIDGNTITSANSNADLELEASGNGYVFVDDIEFQRSKIIATTTNDNLTFSSTGDGYWKLGGTTGVVIPVVDDSGTEPGVQGQLRWNALFGKLEVFTGSIWENGAGFIETVPTEDANEINFEQSLIFG